MPQARKPPDFGFPVKLGDRAHDSYQQIGRTSAILTPPHPNPVTFTEIVRNVQAITEWGNALPVPMQSFVDVVDGFTLESEGEGPFSFNVEAILNDNDYTIQAGIWVTTCNIRVDRELPDFTTGGSLFLTGGGIVAGTDNRAFGTRRGVWNGDDDKGWDTPRYAPEGDACAVLNSYLTSFGPMRQTATDTIYSGTAIVYTLDTPGTEGDADVNGSPETSENDAGWNATLSGYRLSDERFNSATVVDGSDWPTFTVP